MTRSVPRSNHTPAKSPPESPNTRRTVRSSARAACGVGMRLGDHPLCGSKKPWMAPNVPLATVLAPHAPRSPELTQVGQPSGASGGTSRSSRMFPAAACMEQARSLSCNRGRHVAQHAKPCIQPSPGRSSVNVAGREAHGNSHVCKVQPGEPRKERRDGILFPGQGPGASLGTN